MMKLLVLNCLIVVLVLVNHSLQNTTGGDQHTIENTETTTTAPWWTRTFPIRITTTRPRGPFPTPKSTTPLSRVSDGVTIGVSVTIFVVALIGGFVGLYMIQRKKSNVRPQRNSRQAILD